jgi:hypothetical protein
VFRDSSLKWPLKGDLIGSEIKVNRSRPSGFKRYRRFAEMYTFLYNLLELITKPLDNSKKDPHLLFFLKNS